MTVLTDLTFDFDQRIITRAAPALVTSVFDFYDSVKNWEDEVFSLRHESPADASGRNPLGGGEFVGLTMVMINDWRLAYEARSTETAFGTITTPGTLTLTDSTASFLSGSTAFPEPVESGAIIMNKTDGSAATVFTVDSETQLTLVNPGLTGGTDDDFDASDAYGIWNVASCIVEKGNLLAVNSFGDNPILPTFATQVQLRQSAAPVLIVQSATKGSAFVY